MAVSNHNGMILLELDPGGPLLGADYEVNDLLGEAFGAAAEIVVVPVSRLDPGFFELRSRIAGEVFQKMEQYQRRLVILGDIAAEIAASKSLHDFVYETNRRGHHLFVPHREAMLARL
jgi:hypothetical protein